MKGYSVRLITGNKHPTEIKRSSLVQKTVSTYEGDNLTVQDFTGDKKYYFNGLRRGVDHSGSSTAEATVVYNVQHEEEVIDGDWETTVEIREISKLPNPGYDPGILSQLDPDLFPLPPFQLDEEGETNVFWATVNGFMDGYEAGRLTVIDAFTPDFLVDLSEAKSAAWKKAGLEGTWTQTISEFSAGASRELLFTAATAGLGSMAQAGRCGTWATRSIQAGFFAMEAKGIYDSTEALGTGIGKIMEGDNSGWIDVTMSAVSLAGSALGARAYGRGPRCFEGDTPLNAMIPIDRLTPAISGIGLIVGIGYGVVLVRERISNRRRKEK